MKLSYKKKKDDAENKGKEPLKREFVATDVFVDDDERTVTATITTSAVDRYNEVVLAKGADLENFLKNPVVLWVHNSHEPPIAKALWIKKSRNKIVAKLKFVSKEVSEFAEQIYQMYKSGFLKAFSIGFRPDFDEIRAPKPEEIEKNPAWANVRRLFLKWELLEFSAVPVPANPEALATAVKNHELEASPELLKQLGYEVEDEDEEEIHIIDTVTTDDPADTVFMTYEDDDVSADAELIVVKSFIEAEQIITAERAFKKIVPLKRINVHDALGEGIKKHKGRVYD